MDRFIFDYGTEEVKEAGGCRLRYISWRDLSYCDRPLDPIQKLNVFMPVFFLEKDGVCNGYTRDTAPIFLPNAVGGYMPGEAEEPGEDRFHAPNTIFQALEQGYVVVSGGIRGRTSGRETDEFFEGSQIRKNRNASGRSAGEEKRIARKMVGRAPAFIVDYKAIIRYLRHNWEQLPGNVSRIITNGTSAGGALSALAGASGNSSDYEAELDRIGAAKEPDDVFASSCYCPICNLENADAAYEWLYSEEHGYHNMKFVKTDEGIKPIPENGSFTLEQIRLSAELKALFPAYVNSLKLKGPASSTLHGQELTLKPDGYGTFRDYVTGLLLNSWKREKETRENEEKRKDRMVPGSLEGEESYLIRENGNVCGIDLSAFAAKITRMKPVPAFDALDLSSPENEEFGTEFTDGMHFSEISFRYSAVPAKMAENSIIRMMNPMSYIGKAQTARYWRIRHGSFDRDTSFAVPVLLALTLENAGYDVDFALPWGLPHSGDYDLEDLFEWIDRIVREADTWVSRKERKRIADYL